jgi:glucokinase
MPRNPFESPHLLADVGGTYARFALETAPGRLEHRRRLRCGDHADFHAAVRSYLDTLPEGCHIEHAAVAIANPVDGDQVRMTNYHWQFSIEAMRERLGLQTLLVVNDFTALAMAIPRLGRPDLHQVGGGQPREFSVIGVLGSGTGLGVSGLIPIEHGWTSLGSEGGHVSFSPTDEREITILEYARRRFEHVSFERLLSGTGLELIHEALSAATDAARAPSPLPAREITRRAAAGTDATCVQTVDAFCCMLGTVASNLAVTLGAQGGIYIGGAIVPRLGSLFDNSGFRRRFESKGRFRDYVSAIPTYVITAEEATFQGVSAILEAQLRTLGPGSGVLDRVRRVRNELTRAERRVADRVLERPRQILAEPVADIARAAQVSQPTVIRFCRSLGCDGLSDFKLRLASSLGGTVAVTHSQVTDHDTTLELGAKVMDNTAAAILQVRDSLSRDALDRAIALLLGRNRVEFHAVGHFGMVAIDAQFKFLHLGVASTACTDPCLQPLSAAVLTPADTLVVISADGQTPELLNATERALAHGAPVIAITTSQSKLAQMASVALLVDHDEDPTRQMVMVSRVLYLLMVDVLAVGVAMRLGAQTAESEAASRGETPLDTYTAVAPAAVTTATHAGIANPTARAKAHRAPAHTGTS